jgi:hypothetical protein
MDEGRQMRCVDKAERVSKWEANQVIYTGSLQH